MPIYQLSEDLIFPPVDGAEDGIVAIGGDLSAERLILAYQLGIFPWYNDDQPIIWWSPDPRCVIYTDKVHVSKSMKRVLNSSEFQLTFNQDFESVISCCKKAERKGQEGTWINNEMKEAYIGLFEKGHAHSVEVWKDEDLVGGMYGVKIGKVFSGESMFSKVSNASKVALIGFVERFREEGGHMLDCQVYSEHLASMGAEEIDRREFLAFL